MSDKVWEDARITAYVFGALVGDELLEFETELAHNVSLRQAVSEAREITSTVSDAFAFDLSSELTEQRRAKIDKVAEEMESSIVEAEPDSTGSSRRWIPIAMIAASFIGLLTGAVLIEKSIRTRTAASTTVGSKDQSTLASRPRNSYPPMVVSVPSEEDEMELSTFMLNVEEENEAATLGSAQIQGPYTRGTVSESVLQQVGESAPVVRDSLKQGKDTLSATGANASNLSTPESSREYAKLDGYSKTSTDSASLQQVGNSVVSTPMSASALGLRSEDESSHPTRLSAASATQSPELAKTSRFARRSKRESSESKLASPGPGVAGPGPGRLSEVSNKLESSVSKYVDNAKGLETAGRTNFDDKSIAWSVGKQIREQQESGRLEKLNIELSVDSGVVNFKGTIAPSQRVALYKAIRQVDGVLDIVDQTHDRHESFDENAFVRVVDRPLSTFSIDVDTASYSKVRMYLNQHNRLPSPDVVRIEELVNYFEYDYPVPGEKENAFAASMEVASCPWNSKHRLARVAIKGREIENRDRPSSNLVFLLDVSGSMDRPNKLPLLKRGMQMLLDKLGENDRVSIVVYAGAAGLVLDSTTADKRQVIYDALERLKAGGSTNGGEGIQLAYQLAREHFIPGGTNRVILCTDGDFNVGRTHTGDLVSDVEKQAGGGIFLTVLGFGMGNHNDEMLEKISGRGNGNYAFIDTDSEAHKVLVQQISGTLVTIAKNVKIQIEFNPAEVSGYRLIGYENRMLEKEDFNDDKKDAGEIGAGHTVTAFYELVPADEASTLETPDVDELKYQKKSKPSKESASGELLTLKIRHMLPEKTESTLQEFVVKDDGKKFEHASQDFQFAASVASFGMLLRNSPHKGNATFSGVAETASSAKGADSFGLRAEFLKMVQRAEELAGE